MKSPGARAPRRFHLIQLAVLTFVLASANACGSKDNTKKPALSEAQKQQLAALVLDAPPADIKSADVNFGDRVHLVGYAVSPKQAKYPPGTDIKITFVWRCDKPLEEGYRLFTHVVGTYGGRLINADKLGFLRSIDGKGPSPLPPSDWIAGKYYIDEISFQVPADPSPVLVVAPGFFRGNTRLPIEGPGADLENRANIVRLSTGARPANVSAVKELDVPKKAADQSIQMDGQLNEPAWQGAATAGPFVDVSTGRENAALPVQGSVKLLWDEAFLYAGFSVRDKTVRGGWPKDAVDPHLWEKDTIEIMIDPDGDGDNKDYYEIQINPQNLVFDTQYDDYNHPNGGGKGPFGHEEWSAKLESAVTIQGTLDKETDEDEGYTVELKIPWTSLTKAEHAPPLPNQTYRMNFYAMQNNGGTAWSPILGQGNFHKASRFGRVRFTDPKAAPPASASSPLSSASAAPAASAAP